MGIGLGIILIVVGLVLALGVVNIGAMDDYVVDAAALGWILFGAGVLAIVLALIINKQRGEHHVVEERRDR